MKKFICFHLILQLPESKTLNKLAYTNKPLADQEWLKNEKEVKEEELQRMLERRLNGTKVVDSW